MKTPDQHFHDWEGSTFGYGYGSGEEHVLGALKGFMACMPLPPGSYDYNVLERELGPRVAWLLINALAHADIIEYGTSPRFAWLTPQGVALKAYVDPRMLEQLVEATRHSEDYVECYRDYCNCIDVPCRNPFWHAVPSTSTAK